MLHTIGQFSRDGLRQLGEVTGTDGVLGSDTEEIVAPLPQFARREARLVRLHMADADPVVPRGISLLHRVLGDRGAAVRLGRFPDKADGVFRGVRHLQVPGWRWFIWKYTR